MKRMLAAGMAALVLAASAVPAAALDRLVGPSALAAAGDVTIIDIRGPREYATAHLPGAINAPYGAWRGPADNPGAPLSDERLTALMQYLGLTADSRVAITHAGLDETDFGAAARVYWTLKSAGLTEIAILNGGVRGWIAAGRPLSVEPSRAEPSEATFSLSEEWMVDRAAVRAIVAGERAATLIDARPDPFRTGEKTHPAADRAGTIPGSEQLVYDTWFTETPREMALTERIRALAEDAAPDTGGETVSFCNTGHWAAINWFALSEMAGRDDVKLYPESAVGWANAGGETVTRP